MKTITNWKARRAGGRITITGTDRETNATIKVVGVDTIESDMPHPIATDKDGAQYKLA